MTPRVVKLLVSISVACADWVLDALRRLLGAQPATACVVLYYHGVREEFRRAFASQMDQLMRHSVPLDIEGVEPLLNGRRHSAVTFDDSFVSVLENALPELHRRGIPCTIFVPTGSLGRQPSWIDALHQDATEVVTSAEIVRVLGGKPLVRIGSHSVSHPDFRQLDDKQARDELTSSKAALEELVGREVTSFSFPYGAFSRRDLDLAEQCGYKRVFTTDHAQVADPRNAFAVGRVRVGPDDWPLEFRLKVGGAYRWLAPAAAAKRSLLSALRRGRVQRRQPPQDP